MWTPSILSLRGSWFLICMSTLFYLFSIWAFMNSITVFLVPDLKFRLSFTTNLTALRFTYRSEPTLHVDVLRSLGLEVINEGIVMTWLPLDDIVYIYSLHEIINSVETILRLIYTWTKFDNLFCLSFWEVILNRCAIIAESILFFLHLVQCKTLI